MASPAPPPLAVIGVMHEMAQLAPRVTDAASQETPWGRLLLGRWQANGVAVALAGTAVGKIGAAMGAQAVIDAVRPRLVLSCGSAGALAPDLPVGAVVLGDPVLAHDQGVFLPLDMAGRRPGHRPDGFLPAGSTLPRSRRRSFRPLPTLLDQAQQAAQRAGLSAVHVGPLATGDQVILQDTTRRWLRTTFAALAVDNESAAVAQAAHCHGVPWLVIRGISDGADSAAAFDYTPFLAFEEDEPTPRGLERWAQRLAMAVAEPTAWRQVQRFRRGVRQAMANVALLLDALLPMLPQSGPPL